MILLIGVLTVVLFMLVADRIRIASVMTQATGTISQQMQTIDELVVECKKMTEVSRELLEQNDLLRESVGTLNEALNEETNDSRTVEAVRLLVMETINEFEPLIPNSVRGIRGQVDFLKDVCNEEEGDALVGTVDDLIDLLDGLMLAVKRCGQVADHGSMVTVDSSVVQAVVEEPSDCVEVEGGVCLGGFLGEALLIEQDGEECL